ncbi:glycine oxidase ThiO [Alkalicoccus chagannorensis]|uniref:glycine oxidase ThiO n=1 Tax=Alkalicoccus chagannorensis TaxID=427072 RepID=UPI00040D1122|nr:glycine oxidase ThiO [Alkalicoccus chagannorensis]
MQHVIVIGGGIIGLSTAVHALEKGMNVTLLEKGRTGSGATRAAAGMLGAQTERHADSQVLSFALQARAYWKTFHRKLEEWSGAATGYRQEGAFRAAFNQKETAELEKLAASHQQAGAASQWIDPSASFIQEAGALLYFPEEAQVDARMAAEALRLSFLTLGGALHEHTEVTGYEKTASGWMVYAGDNTFQADAVLAAPGAAGLPAGKGPEVYPVKGECAALLPQQQPFSETIVTDDVYLVPKADGRIIIGATETVNDTSDHVTAASITRLLAAAITIVPELADAPLHETWAGIRPQHRSGIPAVAEWDDRFFVSLGHYRNGILLSGLTGNLLSSWLAGGARPEQLAIFSKEEVFT